MPFILKKQFWLILLIPPMLIPLFAEADTIHSENTLSSSKQSETEQTEKNSSVQEQQLAKKWGLTESDWLHYKEIMAGPQGNWTPNIDPITALGINASTDDERRYYAEIWVRKEAERIMNAAKFDQATQEAGNRLYGSVMMEYHPIVDNVIGNKPISRALFFSERSCEKPCRDKLLTLINNKQGVPQLDIFITDAKTDDEIRQFANDLKIPLDQIQNRRITLNHDQGALAKMPDGSLNTVPVVYFETPDGYQKEQIKG